MDNIVKLPLSFRTQVLKELMKSVTENHNEIYDILDLCIVEDSFANKYILPIVLRVLIETDMPVKHSKEESVLFMLHYLKDIVSTHASIFKITEEYLKSRGIVIEDLEAHVLAFISQNIIDRYQTDGIK